jgi:glutathione synthase/RimK-type ligase-like ATP-grasp enzyme
MQFRVARAARITGEMLERLVREKLAADNIPEPDAVVCYGVGYTGPLPCLNGECSSQDKMEQGEALRAALGLEALNTQPLQFILRQAQASHARRFPIPLVARRRQHSQGRDIRVCKTVTGLEAAARNHDFITIVVDSDTEYRAWVYRKRVLAVYEKRQIPGSVSTRFGRNRANGWTFHGLNSENIPEAVRRVAIASVKALDLDFGAVDILGKWVDEAHTDVIPTVLEVNSAPGVSDEHRTAIVKLVKRVVRWAAAGCPARVE